MNTMRTPLLLAILVIAAVAGTVTWNSFRATPSAQLSRSVLPLPLSEPAAVATMAAAAPPVAGSDDPATTTALPLVLQGTFDTGDSATSMALIAARPGAAAANYRIGDSLPGGAILHSVTARTATIAVPAGLQVLELQAGAAAGDTPQAAVGATAGADGEALAYGLRDGDENRVDPQTAGDFSDTPVRRTRSGPVLSPEARAEAERQALDN